MSLKTVTKRWSDETAGQSKIEHLNLPADRKWKRVKVRAKGTKHWQTFHILLMKNGNQTLCDETFQLWNNETWDRSFELNDVCSLSIDGYVMIVVFPPAGGIVELTGEYEDEPEFWEQSITWSDNTPGISVIEHLVLPPDHVWHHVDLRATGMSGMTTGVRLCLLMDGELNSYPNESQYKKWSVLMGTETCYMHATPNRRGSVIATGYITNHSGVTRGGASVTLTGYYRKGD